MNSVNLLKDPERREGQSLGLETVARGLGQVWDPFDSPQKARLEQAGPEVLGLLSGALLQARGAAAETGSDIFRVLSP